ncbi:IS911 orfA [Escherichia coli O145:H28 str. RM12761]|nr:IS911 orfA [Escherichia coli O145:H28 str. RM13516]AHG15988.1 IS911 orfA [Escherichia coli O145:H28 str. RM13516]AHY63784.1 IS911 orfA [Escherichia coli O145:H28 str. RM12761]AHY66312.1 IS911 orfA [Escherichia coli O145:H28 str. RM12761]
MSYHVVEKLFSEYDIRNVVVCFNISISISISISICCDFFFSSCISICF